MVGATMASSRCFVEHQVEALGARALEELGAILEVALRADRRDGERLFEEVLPEEAQLLLGVALVPLDELLEGARPGAGADARGEVGVHARLELGQQQPQLGPEQLVRGRHAVDVDELRAEALQVVERLLRHLAAAAGTLPN